LQVFQLLAGGVAFTPFEVADELLKGFLDNGGRDFFIFLRFITGDLLGGFHGF
jgi:hypothetical protein